MSKWIGSALVQITACRLFGAKPLSKPMLSNCQLNPWGQTSVKFFIKIQNFSFMKMHLKISFAKWRPFCPGGDELRIMLLTMPYMWCYIHRQEIDWVRHVKRVMWVYVKQYFIFVEYVFQIPVSISRKCKQTFAFSQNKVVYIGLGFSTLSIMPVRIGLVPMT